MPVIGVDGDPQIPYQFADGTEILFNTSKFTWEVKEELERMVAQARVKHSQLVTVPMNIGESWEAWGKRCQKELLEADQSDYRRKVTESPEQHAERVYMPKDTGGKIIFDVFCGLCKAVDATPPSLEQFKKSQVQRMKQFTYGMLLLAEVEVPELKPKSPDDAFLLPVSKDNSERETG